MKKSLSVLAVLALVLVVVFGFVPAASAHGYCNNSVVVSTPSVVVATPFVQTYAVQQVAVPQLVAAPAVAPAVVAAPAATVVAPAPTLTQLTVSTAPVVEVVNAFSSYNVPSVFSVLDANAFHLHGHVSHIHHHH